MPEITSDKKRERANLTDYQKHLIVFLATELNMDIDEIREHDKLRTEDGKRILKKTIIYWLNRFEETGDLKVKERSGRPRLLNKNKEKRLIKYIENNSDSDYSVIKEKLKLNMTRRTINNYALRNKIRAYPSKDGKPIRKKTETESAKIRKMSYSKKLLEKSGRGSLAGDENVAINHNRSLVRTKRSSKMK